LEQLAILKFNYLSAVDVIVAQVLMPNWGVMVEDLSAKIVLGRELG